MLTRKQHELLRFIHERLRETGVPPSFDEMKDALDLKSKSGIHRLITALEERGFIRRLPNRARALEVIRLPESTSGAGSQRRFTPSVVEGGLAGKAKAAPPAAGGSARPGNVDPGHGPDRGRHADLGDPDPQPFDHPVGRFPLAGRSLRPGGARRLDGRGRHPRRRSRGDPNGRTRPIRATSSWRSSTTRRRP